MGDSKTSVAWPNRIILIAGLLTCGYLLSLACLLLSDSNIGAGIDSKKWNALGDFLAGVFAPLALVWLVIAVLIQRLELKETRSQFIESQDVVQKQMQFIADQNELMQRQNVGAEENARRTYRLSLFDQRYQVYNELLAFGDDHAQKDFDHHSLAKLIAIQHRAAFIFSNDIEAWISSLVDAIKEYIKWQVELDHIRVFHRSDAEKSDDSILEQTKLAESNVTGCFRTLKVQLERSEITKRLWSALRVSDD